jgi:hypothetical protein
MKRCIKCGEEKLMTKEYFPVRKSAKDGYRNECKTCCNARARHRDKQRLLNETDEQRVQRLAKYKVKREKPKVREKRKRNKAAWDERNKEHRLAYSKEYYSNQENRDKVNAYRRNRRATDPVYKLQANVRCAIRHGFFYHNAAKDNSTWKALPYTPQQLKEHLERQFSDWMTWENYGKRWDIDHIYPQSKLPFDSFNHPNFIRCWSLDNLQPLEKIANIKKSNHITNE